MTELAHAGGWDEALVLLAPIALFVGLRVLERRRHRRGRPAEDREEDRERDREEGRRGP